MCGDCPINCTVDEKHRLRATLLGRLRMMVDECIDACVAVGQDLPETETPRDDQRPDLRPI